MIQRTGIALPPGITRGCSTSAPQIRQASARHYAQPDACVPYPQKIQNMDANALASYAAAEDKKQMRGLARLNVDEVITVEAIQAKGNKVVNVVAQ